ncbi:hypothetical protein EBS43_08980 [bacterium]|jgi:hypothetical protein|nr:hypothetical protein [bacterium]
MAKKGREYSGFWIGLFDDQEAQATTEYILMLSIIVGSFVLIFRSWLGPMFSKMMRNISGMIDNRLSKADLHTLRF